MVVNTKYARLRFLNSSLASFLAYVSLYTETYEMSFCLILALFCLYLQLHSPLCSFDICKINHKISSKNTFSF